ALACTTCTHVLASGESLCASCERREAGETSPWERRADLGLTRAVAATIFGVLLRPGTFFAHRPRERALWPTLLLGMGLHVFGALGQLVVNLAYGDRIRADLQEDPIARQLMWAASDEYFIAQALVSPLAFVLGTYVLASLWWIGLRAVSGLRRPFHVIVRALCYAQAVSVLVPLIAPLPHLGPLGAVFGLAFMAWWLAIQIVGVSRMQGTTLSRGVLAFFVWLSLAGCVACLAGGASLWVLASHIRIPNL
nr:YIP1 family protein [Myxococcota bacterium]